MTAKSGQLFVAFAVGLTLTVALLWLSVDETSNVAGAQDAGSHIWSTDADFSRGTFTNTEAISNSVQLKQATGLGYASDGEYLGEIYDAGDLVDWATLVYTDTVPAGTTLAIYTRVGNSPTPDVIGQAGSPTPPSRQRFPNRPPDISSTKRE